MQFDGNAATNVTVTSPTTLTATTPAGAAGPVPVTVTDSDGTSNAQTYTYADTVDLAVTLVQAPNNPVSQGSNVQYTATVTNNGPSDATAVSLVDTLPVGATFVSAGAGCTPASTTVTC